MGLTENGRQRLREAADPNRGHAYKWYVFENINTPEEWCHGARSLEDAIRLYSGLDTDSKRLGVSKDGIADVDLLIRHDGREWVSEDWTKDKCFSKDPVVAEAVSLLQQTLEEQTTGQCFTMGGPSL